MQPTYLASIIAVQAVGGPTFRCSSARGCSGRKAVRELGTWHEATRDARTTPAIVAGRSLYSVCLFLVERVCVVLYSTESGSG